jgi:hypothetical protein
MSIVLENAATAVRRELDKALVRRKNVKHYIWVATFAANPETSQKNLDKYLPEIANLDIKIKELQDRLADIKAQLREMGIAFTIKATKPLTTRKSPPPRGSSTKNMSGKTSFILADDAREFISDLSKKGYSFHGKPGKSPVLRHGEFHGVQWCDTPEGKLFFYTTRQNVFRCYSSDKR